LSGHSFGNLFIAALIEVLGDVEGADADVAWLLNHDETNEDALLLKARIEEARQHHASAMEFYGKVIAQNPFNVDAFRERGAIRLAQGDKQGAEEDMKQEKAIMPIILLEREIPTGLF